MGFSSDKPIILQWHPSPNPTNYVLEQDRVFKDEWHSFVHVMESLEERNDVDVVQRVGTTFKFKFKEPLTIRCLDSIESYISAATSGLQRSFDFDRSLLDVPKRRAPPRVPPFEKVKRCASDIDAELNDGAITYKDAYDRLSSFIRKTDG